MVISAVDNDRSRLNIDRKCVWYEKPMFTCGTLATKCHTQVVIPRKTQIDGDSQDPSDN